MYVVVTTEHVTLIYLTVRGSVSDESKTGVSGGCKRVFQVVWKRVFNLYEVFKTEVSSTCHTYLFDIQRFYHSVSSQKRVFQLI